MPKGSVTFEQFKKALAEYYEDFTVGYHEQPTEQDLNDLYEDFLEFGKSFAGPIDLVKKQNSFVDLI